jgi:hypothetical protein
MPPQPPNSQSVHPMSHQMLAEHFASLARASSAGLAQPSNHTPTYAHSTGNDRAGGGVGGVGYGGLGSSGGGNLLGTQKRARGNSDVHAHGHSILSNLGLATPYAFQQQLLQQNLNHPHMRTGGGFLNVHPGNINTAMPLGAKIHKVGNLDLYGSPRSAAAAAQLAAAAHARSQNDGAGAGSGSSAGGHSEDDEPVVAGECPPAELREKGRVYTVRGHLKKWDGRRFARCCGANGCTKLAQGPTNYCKGHGGGTRCKSAGCKKAARGGSDCCAVHGGGKRCKNFGCVKAAVGNDFCRRHGGGRRCLTADCSGTARGSATMCSAHGGESSTSALAKSPIMRPRSVTGSNNSMSPGADKDPRDRSASETSYQSASSGATAEGAKTTTSRSPTTTQARRTSGKKEGFSMADSPNTVAEGEFEHPDAISSLLSIGRRLIEHHAQSKEEEEEADTGKTEDAGDDGQTSEAD